jgi:DNA-binding NarL/FixJ family response regulator
MASPTITIAAVDDHQVICEGVRHMFGSRPGVHVVVTASSIEQFQATGLDADVVLLDLYLGTAGPSLWAVRELTKRHRVLVMSVSSKPSDVRAAIQAGAAGYLVKQADADTFFDAVDQVAGGGFYLSSQLADILHTAEQRPPLSSREEEILRYLAQGFTHQQAARRMGISATTVATYIKRIRAKFGPANAAELGRLAVELGVYGQGPDRGW